MNRIVNGILLLGVFGFSSCATVSINQYEEIDQGMSVEDVTGIIGQDATKADSPELEEGETLYQWKEKGNMLLVRFQGEKVVGKSYLSAADAIHQSWVGGEQTDTPGLAE